MREGKLPHRRLVAFVSVALATIIYALRLDHNVGLMVDDSWYVLLAKSLAEGHGYQLINSTAPHTHPLYPPGYPALLSLLWYCYPQFPANVVVLKLLSLLAIALTGVLLFHLHRQYFQLPSRLNYLQTSVALLTPLLVYYATATLLAETVFLLVQTGVLLLGYQARTARGQWRGWTLVVALGLLAGVAAMIRVIGLALVGAGALALLSQRRLRAALVVLGLGLLPLGVWEACSLPRASVAPEERANYAANSYRTHFWRTEMLNADSPTITPTQFAKRVGQTLRQISTDSLGEIFLPFTRPKHSPFGAVASLAVSLLLALGCWRTLRTGVGLPELYFLLSLLLILGWGFSPTRFLVMLFPLLLQYFQTGLAWCAVRCQGEPLKLQTAITLLLLLGFIAVHAALLSAKYEWAFALPWKSKFVMLEQQRTLAEIIPWVQQQLPADAILATDAPALIYLHTNRQTVYLIDPIKDRALWHQLGIRYLVFTGLTTASLPKDESLSLLFTTENRKAAVYQIK